MTVVDFIEITKTEATAAVRDASWIQYRSNLASCGHPGCEEHPGGVERIHTLSSKGFGADWDVDEAVSFVESAARCGWLVGALGHDLIAVDATGYRIRFEVKRPAVAA